MIIAVGVTIIAFEPNRDVERKDQNPLSRPRDNERVLQPISISRYLSRRRRLRRTIEHYLPDLVYGANDGLITTFAVVSGVAGASLASSIILILGFANLLADGFSMGASNYLSMRSRVDRGRGQPRTDAVLHGSATFGAFVVAGAVPLIAYVVPIPIAYSFTVSIGLTLVTLFIVGALRAAVIELKWWRSGMEMLLVGSGAAALAYVIGAFLATLIGQGL
ncbi:MAG: VIT1/CCC1 transporter family protein [Chloroflexota bacterium]